MFNKTMNLKLSTTTDPSIFKKLDGNRIINKPQLKKLVALYKIDPEFTYRSPIIVNENMEIIDGQHRVEAADNLIKSEDFEGNITLYYIVRDGLTLKDAQKINSGAKVWGPKDYALAYKNENPAYKTYLDFTNQTGLNHEIVSHYLSSSYSLNSFKDGNFTIDNKKQSQIFFDNLEDVGSVITAETNRDKTYWGHRSFALALLPIMKHPDYDNVRMCEQLEEYYRYLTNVEMKGTLLRESLLKIYNKDQEEKIFID